MRESLLGLLLLFASCATGEDIRVRDRGEPLFSGRVRHIESLRSSDQHSIGIGAELGGYGTSGDYTTATGTRNYRVAVGYAAFAAEIGIGPVRVLPKIGIGLGDFNVVGQTTTIREDGLGAIFGIEGRYCFSEPWDAFARGMSFQRSSLDASMLEFGVGYHPSQHVILELGYGIAGNVVDETVGLVNIVNSADVETQGVLLSMTLRF